MGEEDKGKNEEAVETQEDVDRASGKDTFKFMVEVSRGENGDWTAGVEEVSGGKGEIGVEGEKQDQAMAEIAGEFAKGELSGESLAKFLEQSSQVVDRPVGELQGAVKKRLEEMGYSSVDEALEAIESGELSSVPIPEIAEDNPELEELIAEYNREDIEELSTEEEAGGEVAPDDSEASEQRPEEAPEEEVEEEAVDEEDSSEDEVRSEESGEKEKIDTKLAERKARWVYEAAKGYGKGKENLEGFLEKLVKVREGVESVSGEMKEEAKAEAEGKLEELGIKSFENLRDRLGYSWLHKNEYAPMAELVTDSQEEFRLVMEEVGKMVNKDKLKTGLKWVLVESVFIFFEEMGNVYEKTKQVLYQALQEEIQRT